MFYDPENPLVYKRKNKKKNRVRQEEIISEVELRQKTEVDGISIIGDQRISLLDGDIPFERGEDNEPRDPSVSGKLAEQMRYNEAVEQVADFVRQKFQYAADARKKSECIWLDNFLQYRGEFNAEQLQKLSEYEALNPGTFRAYIKITKTKVQAAISQLTDLLYSDGRFPIGVQSTPVPEGVADTVYLEPEDAQTQKDKGQPLDIYGYNGDGKEIAPGTTAKSLLAGLYEKTSQFLKGKKVTEGPSPDKTKLIQLNPAEESAYNMDKLLQDQLAEGKATEIVDRAVFEMTVLGTGAIKGPYNFLEVVHKYEQDPETKKVSYKPYTKISPRFSHVSVWNFYYDPEALTVQDASFVIERHLPSREKLRSYTSMESFSKEAILRVLETPPSVTKFGWEEAIRDSTQTESLNRYEVLEYWGYLSKELAEAMRLDLAEFEDDLLDVVQVNAWVCNNIVIRLVLNPFTPSRIPYFAVPYEVHPYQIPGIGVPENMKDSQTMVNGHTRLAVDNLKLSGSVMLEVNESQFKPGQDFRIYPGKTWRKQGGAPGQGIYGITVPNTTQHHVQMVDMAMRWGDMATQIPSITHGQTGVSGTGRTAAGLSMLMSAASGANKQVIHNLDQYLFVPLGEALFQWNMQFNEENVDIRGDLKVVATGTKSIMQREVFTQRLISFLQIAGSNPTTAAMVNFEYAIKQLAISMGLDPDKMVNDMQKAMMYAELMGKANGQGNSVQPQGPATMQEGVQPSPQAVAGNDSTGGGGGNIGVGASAVPGEAAFPANGLQ